MRAAERIENCDGSRKSIAHGRAGIEVGLALNRRGCECGNQLSLIYLKRCDRLRWVDNAVDCGISHHRRATLRLQIPLRVDRKVSCAGELRKTALLCHEETASADGCIGRYASRFERAGRKIRSYSVDGDAFAHLDRVIGPIGPERLVEQDR